MDANFASRAFNSFKGKLGVKGNDAGSLISAMNNSKNDMAKAPVIKAVVKKVVAKAKPVVKAVAKAAKPVAKVATKVAPKTFAGKSMKLGGGGRFAKVVAGVEKSGKSPKVAKAIAATMGRNKLGAAKMGKLAAAGKARVAKKA